MCLEAENFDDVFCPLSRALQFLSSHSIFVQPFNFLVHDGKVDGGGGGGNLTMKMVMMGHKFLYVLFYKIVLYK
ncbi:hypothetical protein HanXRQr2_Chr07g0289271 [Helianthus annuus]|uniref:Uncharacterized protein n=1 Tax=Helianthus annuus TaxID=4232 RepID=A0A9K3IJU9_HELAN|nr:hypothetical protein HanXRQr2_Chr07g0289271 [Helianthus annuus]